MASALARRLRPGDLLVAGQVLGEPTALITALFEDPDRPEGLRLFSGMSLTSVLDKAPSDVELSSFVGMGPNSALIGEGRMRLVPCHMSELSWAMSEGPLRPDVVLLLVSPPDEHGRCSLGVVSDYLWGALRSARVVLAEVNPGVPRVAGDTEVPLERLDDWVHSDRPLPEYPRAEPNPVETAIAARVAEYIGDGSCVQVGIGRLGEAVLRAIAGRRDLGIHAGMVGETVLELVRDGVVTNARKRVDRGLTVTGSILGGARAVALAGQDRTLRLRSIEHTHSGSVIAELDDFVCVNSALEVDLLGQVNAEVLGGRYVGGVGGSVDYLRAAVRARGGRSVVTLPATGRGGSSRIVPAVERVTALGTDVDLVVTEYGVARLRGMSQGERVGRLISIAAPAHRDHLRDQARRLGL